MAKASMIALVALAVCLSSLCFAFAAEDKLFVEGKVYCDTCRVEFETKLSEPIKGATVHLECRNRTDDTIVHSQDAVTNESGIYSMAVEGDHEDEICEVSLVKSPREDCNEFMEAWKKARVVLTRKDGVCEPVRYANSLGFLKKEAVSGCAKVLIDMGFLPLN